MSFAGPHRFSAKVSGGKVKASRHGTHMLEAKSVWEFAARIKFRRTYASGEWRVARSKQAVGTGDPKRPQRTHYRSLGNLPPVIKTKTAPGQRGAVLRHERDTGWHLFGGDSRERISIRGDSSCQTGALSNA